MAAKTFEIDVPQDTLDDLRARLAMTRWPDVVKGARWDYGTNREYLEDLVAYWRDGFDWRAQEAALNGFAHYRAEVGGIGVHFIHEPGMGTDPMPIVLTHGWPDSFWRMHKIIPMLADPASHGGDPADSFSVVVPSLPGYGFSDKPDASGMDTARTAELWHLLMTDVLGYTRFAAHGGDMGSAVTQDLALTYPDDLIGIHLTDLPFTNLMRSVPDEAGMSDEERDYFAKGKRWSQEEGAYAILQSTKPQTLAYGLNDSPAGLASWIVEKFHTWSDCDGDIESRFSKDELLTNITLYWVTETIGSSIRLYFEVGHAESPPDPTDRPEVPAAFAIFPKDIMPPPPTLATRFFQIERWTRMPRGGHFAALEEPELLVDDIRAFFRQFR